MEKPVRFHQRRVHEGKRGESPMKRIAKANHPQHAQVLKGSIIQFIIDLFLAFFRFFGLNLG
jgi:hypothetical protein